MHWSEHLQVRFQLRPIREPLVGHHPGRQGMQGMLGDFAAIHLTEARETTYQGWRLQRSPWRFRIQMRIELNATYSKGSAYPWQMRVAVFCSSSPTIESKYVELATELGAAIGERNWELVSGGGHISMMGAVARGVRASGGKTIGVIPQSLVDIEFADHDSHELHVVDSMRERKAMIEDLSDAFIALPGGPGTLEELFEIWVGRFLKFHNKPVIILDPFDLYGPLRALLDHLEVHGFVKPGQRELLHWTTDVSEALLRCQ